MEHEISAEYNVTHGAGLAVIFPAFLHYAAEHNPHKVAQLGHRVFGVNDTLNPTADAHETAERKLKIASAAQLQLRLNPSSPKASGTLYPSRCT